MAIVIWRRYSTGADFKDKHQVNKGSKVSATKNAISAGFG
jgi:hypothetical protein